MSVSREATVERIADLFQDIMRAVFSWKPAAPAALTITLGELKCMMAVGRLGAPSMKQLCDRLQLKPSTATALVNGLVREGLAERVTDPQDRRMVRVTLTPKGKHRRKRHRRARRRQLMTALGSLDDQQLQRILRALEMVREAARRTTKGKKQTGLHPKGERE